MNKAQLLTQLLPMLKNKWLRALVVIAIIGFMLVDTLIPILN